MSYIEENLHTNCWFDYPQFYSWIAKKDGINVVGEVGSWKGHSTTFLAKNMFQSNKNFSIYAIDIWNDWEFYTKFDDTQKQLLEDVRNSYQIYCKNVLNSGMRSYIRDIKGDSFHAHENFIDGFFDMVFLDADHSYEAVKKDIQLWLPKVRTGGILSGHDYFQKTCGVKKAVDELLNGISTMGNVWYITKGK